LNDESGLKTQWDPMIDFSKFEMDLYLEPVKQPPTIDPVQKKYIQSRRKDYMKSEDIIQHYTTELEKKKCQNIDNYFDQSNNCIGLLRDNNIIIGIDTRELIIGRLTEKSHVDFDLTPLLSNPKSISKIQAIVKLQYNANFYIKNIGKGRIFVNGQPVIQKKKN